MIGERIRQVRIARGLSQSQLAGHDLTRSFISQVETGRCLPSPQTLNILAKRLGKPVAYFLEEEATNSYGVQFLWASAQADVQAGDWESALPKLEESLQLIRRTEVPDREREIQLLYAQCLYHLGKYENALDQFEDLANYYNERNGGLKSLETWMGMANCYFDLEQYSMARRLYQKVIQHSIGLKTAQDLHVRAWVYFGSANVVLGDLPGAQQAYHRALSAADADFMPDTWGQAAYGLGLVYRRLGQPTLAVQWNRKAWERLKLAASPLAPQAEVNLAVALMAINQWEEAYTRLSRLLVHYRDSGNNQIQAEILHNLMRYWLQKEDYERAETLCLQAIDLLTADGTSYARGKFYRDLASIVSKRGQNERARELLQVSYALLQHVHASEEIVKTQKVIETLSQLNEQD